MEAKSSCVNQVNTHLFKVNNRNARKACEICSKLAIKTTEQRHCSSVFSVNFEHISHRVSIVHLEQVNVSWEIRLEYKVLQFLTVPYSC